MSIQFQARDKMPELRQSHSSSSSTGVYAYPYFISSPSDAADGPKAETTAMNTKETIRSTVADSESGMNHIPIAYPWPESKPTVHTKNTSPPSAEENEEEDDDIDAQLKVVLESFRDLYRESKDLFRKVFSDVQPDHLLKTHKKDEHADPEKKAFLEMGKKKISRILMHNKRNQTKPGMFQRSLSVDSPRSPLDRFKIKPLELRGGGGGPKDVKGSTKDR